ncbi:Nif3-like dinuclear metal center hexameric protein [Candidatus Micrarchaeota archaeon CG10_big_fil_rev_8_21_14_0_10_59_7]|nr:MAG: Nif3-like dinuclear metal center hexameric protein [Candidatus Micrarchaeota archaeon CG10_big_fil_rev_8_21_14_0_10_59_7]
MVSLGKIVSFLDAELKVRKFDEDSINGLQFRGAAEVRRVSFAVDACLSSFEKARGELLIVHHGMFWKKTMPLKTDALWRRRFATLKKKRLSVYAVHLPLDAHPALGNNAEMARRLGVKKLRPFAEYDGVMCGLTGVLPAALPLRVLGKRVGKAVGGKARVFALGKTKVKRVGLVTGGGGFGVLDAKCGDVLVTGEFGHSKYHFAKEKGINVIAAGHYKTEKLGLEALEAELRKRFGVATEFVESPTGL